MEITEWQQLKNIAATMEMSHDRLKDGIETVLKEHGAFIPTEANEDGTGTCYCNVFWIAMHAQQHDLDVQVCHGTVFHPEPRWHGHAWLMSGDGLWCADYASKHEIILPSDAYMRLGSAKDVRVYDVDKARELALEHSSTGPWHEETEQ